jgi:hypothetical protein
VDEIRPYHHGPTPAECPVACLLSVLSRKAWLPLSRAQRASCEPPRTVGDVLELYANRQLGESWNLGKRRTAEIETALIFAGFDLTVCRHRPHKQASPGSVEGASGQ